MAIDRRQFLQYSVATLVVGTQLPWLLEGNAYGAVPVQTLDFTMTDAMKEMVTHNTINTARCYFWVYRSNTPNIAADCPGPNIFATEGDTIQITLRNELDENHAFFIPGVVDSGPIIPGGVKTISFKAPAARSYLYYDNLNAPVNRMMGLHGAFVVMPKRRWKGHKFTPYSHPTPAIQQLFDDFGTAHWPGLAWEQGDPSTNTPAFRQHIWVLHQASPVLFDAVGNWPAGQDYPAAQFTNLFLNDTYADTFHTNVFNNKAQFFTINGQSGHFSHNNPFICPMHRVGEPTLIRVLNAGMHTHSCHIHANHQYVLSLDGQIKDNLWWVDTMTAHPLTGFEYMNPYMRPPDVPNQLGIGQAHLSPPLQCIANPAIPGSTPHPTWPPTEELNTFIPPVGTKAGNGVDLSVQLSPLCYPMHDHSEASQTAQGGNYNCGLISGINFTGDRNTPDPITGGVTTFPNFPTIQGPNSTGPAAPPFV